MSKYSLFLILVIATLVLISGCAGTDSGGTKSIGLVTIDGQVDDVEASLVRAATGAAFVVQPTAIAPTYAATKAILAADGLLTLSALPEQLQTKVLENGFTAVEAQAVVDIVNVAVAKVRHDLTLPDISGNQVSDVLMEIVRIVNETAAVRLGL